MSTHVEVPGELLQSRLREYLTAAGQTVSDRWAALADEEWPDVFSGNVAEKAYWVDLYRRRQEDASALGSGLADVLAKVVRELSDFNGDRIVLVLVSLQNCSYFVWLSPDFSRAVSCFRAKDKRKLEGSG
ncbi:hypothetical protein [Lentzea aerocolonigenes]|uniref:hypothetical protein n=1 Tax=Lentzea aerocolonigenes TaxID=68170 RepID=UPI0012DDBF56|nr:hypothetical protein [Lentzea aerocolonigenes]